MNTEDPHIVIANLMAFRLARVPIPTSSQMAAAAKIAGEMLYHAEHEGIDRWRQLRREKREAEKEANKTPSTDPKLSSSSAPSFSPGDTQ